MDEGWGQGGGKSPTFVSVLDPFIITCSAFGKFHARGFCTENACVYAPLRFLPTPPYRTSRSKTYISDSDNMCYRPYFAVPCPSAPYMSVLSSTHAHVCLCRQVGHVRFILHVRHRIIYNKIGEASPITHYLLLSRTSPYDALLHYEILLHVVLQYIIQ